MKAPKVPRQKVTFLFRAPVAQSVLIVGDFTDWQANPLEMTKQKDGTWKKVVSLPAGRYEYKLLVDGNWEDDPECPIRQPNQ